MVQPVNYQITIGRASGAAEKQPDFSQATPSLTAFPNPAQGIVQLQNIVPWSANRTQLSIYNQAGVLINTLPVPPGASRLIWNGLDAGNQRVQSGIYFAKLASDAFSVWTKLTLMN